MASSKEKAVGLKDAYVAGLLDSAGPEVAAEAGAGALQELAGKLGMEQGQQASIHLNLDRDTMTESNDGDGSIYVTRGGGTGRESAPQYAYPARDQRRGWKGTVPLSGGLRYETGQNIERGFYRGAR